MFQDQLTDDIDEEEHSIPPENQFYPMEGWLKDLLA